MTQERVPRVLDWVFDLLTLAAVVTLLVRLGGFAADARFAMDECYHASMSQWIAAHGELPRRTEGLYSGFSYFYPPLLHILGGAWVKGFGADALRYLNVAMIGGLLAMTWLATARLESRSAARLAVLLLTGYPALQVQGMILYVEALSALLTVAAALAGIALMQRPSNRRAVGLGILVGLAVLAKQSALVLLAGIASYAAWCTLRKEGALARHLWVAAGVATAFAAPYLLRNAVLFGSPLYPVLAPDAHRGLEQMNRIGFTPGTAKFSTRLFQEAGLAVPIAVVAALALALRRRSGVEPILLWVGALALAAAPLVPMINMRHVIPLVAAMLVLAAAVIAFSLARKPILESALTGVLVVVTASSVFQMPNYRDRQDVALEFLEACEAIRQRTPEHASILTIYTYEVFHYTGRAATWPIPWGQRDPPVDIFYDRAPDSLYAHLRRHRIDYLFLHPRPTGEVFNSANFPSGFLALTRDLLQQGKLELVWSTPVLGLIRVVPAEAESPPRSVGAAGVKPLRRGAENH